MRLNAQPTRSAKHMRREPWRFVVLVVFVVLVTVGVLIRVLH